MGLVQALTKIFHKQNAAEVEQQTIAPAAPQVKSILDFTPGSDSDITLGVKYVGRNAWQITPPAGWRKQENTQGIVWPNGGVSPCVTFSNPNVAAGDQAMIRWTLLATGETEESHQLLESLFNAKYLTAESVASLEAPGMVKGMKINRVEKTILPSGVETIVVSARVEQCRGEQAVLRFVLIFPDRQLEGVSNSGWYRETIQFVATENSFWTVEKLAIQSMRTFRRATIDQTSSGTFQVISPNTVSAR